MAGWNSIEKKKLVYGVGVNDANYVVRPTAKARCPFHRCWQNMLTRCYSEKSKLSRPTYIGCEVCEEWWSFMAFKSWMELQDWHGKQLDKDLIGDGKLYSPESCVFVSIELNLLFGDHGAARGEYPTGVCWDKTNKTFVSYISMKGKLKRLGRFASASDAHESWRKAKLEIANSYLSSETNPRVRYAIECGIEKLQLKGQRMINTKPERTINGINLVLDESSTNERWKAMHNDKQVAEIRLVAGELGVQYPVGAGGDIHQAMVVASVNTFDCERRRDEHLAICVRKIRERMVSDGSLEVEEVTFDQMDGKVIKHVRPPWITSTDGFICHVGS